MNMPNLVELEAFFPDIEPELPRCPTPVIENRIRDAIIDACERANIWRWEHPEILLMKGVSSYDLLTPTSDTLIHSVLSVKLNGRCIDGDDSVSTHETACQGSGYYVAERGQLTLARVPLQDSTPFYNKTTTVIPPIELKTGQELDAYFAAMTDPVSDESDYLGNTSGFFFGGEQAFTVLDGMLEHGYAYSANWYEANGPVNGIDSFPAYIDKRIYSNFSDASDGIDPATRIPMVDEQGDPIMMVLQEYGGYRMTPSRSMFTPRYINGIEVMQATDSASLQGSTIETVTEIDPRPYRGIEAVVSVKPSRTTLEVSEVLHRDYYQLIRYGALAKGLMMLNRPWTNLEMAKEMEKQYEYALAKAKQGIDRGFRTGSQRIKPRRFA